MEPPLKTQLKYAFIFFNAMGVLICIPMIFGYMLITAEELYNQPNPDLIDNIILTFLFVMPLWWIWILFTPFVIKLFTTFPINRQNWKVNGAIHFLASLVFMLAHIWLMASLIRKEWVGIQDHFLGNITGNGWPQVDLLIYWGIGAIIYIQKYFNQLRTNLTLESELNQAKLVSLKMQMQPHFLFNTLNTIQSFILKENKEKSLDTLDKFSTLLRESIDSSMDSENTLNKEIQFIENYLKIEKIRFGEYLNYSINIEASCKEIKIPHLILQPIIENSIKHGISKIETQGIITIDARKKGNNVVITIADNGPGMELPYAIDKARGIGLANITSRHETIYGKGDFINISINKWGGLTVIVQLPILD